MLCQKANIKTENMSFTIAFVRNVQISIHFRRLNDYNGFFLNYVWNLTFFFFFQNDMKTCIWEKKPLCFEQIVVLLQGVGPEILSEFPRFVLYRPIMGGAKWNSVWISTFFLFLQKLLKNIVTNFRFFLIKTTKHDVSYTKDHCLM